MQSSKIVETPISIVSWIDEEGGIILSRTKPDVVVTIDYLKEAFAVYKNEFTHPNKKLLLEVTAFAGSSKETRDFLLGTEGIFNYVDALAILSHSKYSIGAITSHALVILYALKKPTKLFYDEQKALDWLKSIK